MPDGVVTVGTQVNLPPLRTGMAEAQSIVKQASQNMAEAQKAFGAAAAAGSEQAATALKLYQAELRSAESTLASFASTQTRVSASTRTVTTDFYAAQGASAALAGRIPYRAMERFLASLPGVSAALRTAFPLIGALAIGEVLARGSEKLVKFALDAENLAERTGTGWLNGAIGQLNGLQAAADQADEAIAEIAQDMDRLASESQRAQFEHIRLIDGPAAAYRAEAEAKQKQLEANNRLLQIQLADQADLKEKSQERGSAQNAKTGITYDLGPTQDALKAQVQIAVVTKQINDLQKSNNLLMQESANLSIQADQADQKSADKLAKHDNAALAKKTREVLELYRQIDAQNEKIARDTEEIAKQQTLIHASLQEDSDLTRNASVMEELKASGHEQVENLKEQVEQYRLIHEAAIKAAAEKYRAVEQSTQGKVEAGQMQPGQRVALLQQAAAQEYATQMQAIQNKEALDRGYLDKFQSDLDQQAQLTQAYNQKQQQLAQQAVLLMQQPYREMYSQITGAFNTFIDSQLEGTQRLSAAFLKLGDSIAMSMINATVKWGEKQIEQEAISLAMHTASELRKTAQHLLGITTRETADATANATTAATTSTTNTAAALSYAAVAAAGAAAATAMIPIVGPALAPAAAASTYADTSAYAALAAFDKGTSFIPRDGVAMLHKGEAVLPPPQTEALTRALSGGRRGSSESHFHYSPQISGIDGPSVAGALQQHGQTFMREQYRQLRKMNLVQ